MADPDSLLTWRKQGRDVWAVNAAVSAKHFPSDSFLPCIKELLLPFSRREDSRRCKGREGSRGAALHTHIHCALTHENYSVPISPRLSGAQSSLPCTSELLDSPVPKASLTPPLPHCCSAAQGLPEQRGTLLSCSNPLTASPRKIQVWEAWYYSQTEKELEVSQDE